MKKSICIFSVRSRSYRLNILIAYSPLLCMLPPPTPAIISSLISLFVWLLSIFLYQRVCLSVCLSLLLSTKCNAVLWYNRDNVKDE